MDSKQKNIQHLFLRAAFGETPERIKALSSQGIQVIVDDLIRDSTEYKEMAYLPYPLSEDQEEKGVGGFQLVKMILKSKKDLEELNTEWIFKMKNTKAVLREKMVFFWHNHFATSVSFAYLMQLQNNTIRKYALGKFSDLLKAIASDPAMILYLNNQQNKKNSPNENFAREVMELFTLGIGNYTEKDVKEAARAFTAWTVNSKGEFEFHPKQHDDGEKEFMGKKGNFNGEDILDILLQNKYTAVFVTEKIYKEFVNPNINPKHTQEMADMFFDSGYDIEKLMRHVFSSDWFYEEVNIGAKISSPVELIVRYGKLLKIEFKEEKTLLNLQKALGQVLFFPPNVAGWKGGNSWIDSTSLLLRLSLPDFILNRGEIALKAKPAFEAMDEAKEIRIKKGKVKSDWTLITKTFMDTPEDKLADELSEFLLQLKNKKTNRSFLEVHEGLTKEEKIIAMAAQIMALPEFQMI